MKLIIIWFNPLLSIKKEKFMNTDEKIENLDGEFELMKVRKFGNLYSGSCPQKETFEQLNHAGIRKIIDLKNPGETPFSDEELAKEVGLEYFNFPIGGIQDFQVETLQTIASLINDEPVLVYCMSANRVGAWLTHHLKLLENLTIEDATQKGIEFGMDKPQLIEMTKAHLS
jgi:protein tyrosine phosphatase (PTP) superfamily phosphohydrolase (DUF442 family)